MMVNTPSLEDLNAAHQRIKPFIHRTPVYTSESINKISGCSIYFKCENLQKIGAFKIRGATNAILKLSDTERANGVCTHSSGNHAQAIALAARENGLKAYVVMPKNSSKVKVEAVKGYGADITFCKNSIASRQETLDRIKAATHSKFIHPFDNIDVITGQATAAKELLEDIEKLDIITAPIGGGGLMSGTCLATHYLSPTTQIIGSEPEKVDDALRSLASGSIQTNEQTETIADGLKTDLSKLTFEIIQEHVRQIITVSEDEIIAAMRMVWERMKMIIEPSSAVPLAAILKEPSLFNNRRVGLIVTGGNVELKSLPFKT